MHDVGTVDFSRATQDTGSQALSRYIFTTKYANFRAGDSRRETWDEAVDRVFAMHRDFYAAKKIDNVIDEVEGSMRAFEILGSQRTLQFGGRAMLQKHARGYNCTFSYADRPRFFAEAFWLLLCGAGVGFSVQKHHVKKLPRIFKPRGAPIVHVVADTIEGWADAAHALFMSYFKGSAPVVFDYSKVRDKGSLISTGAGLAPGPEPLARAIEDVRRLLDRCLAEGRKGGKLRPVDVYDAVMFLSQAVLSGGVRRSATICLFSVDDEQMLTAKTGDWYKTNPQRARSNNSAMLLRDKTSFSTFARLVKLAREWGEPGFYWTDDLELGTNPCVEIGLYPVDLLTGETGWQFCNLSLINVATATTKAEFIRRARLAAYLGTLQAGYTDFSYLGPVSERITRRESLLGVSMTGMQENRAIVFDPETLREAAAAAVAANKELAERIGIPQAARVTCVKPEGTSSCLLGTSSGIHPHHSRRYIRRAQATGTEAPALHYAQANPHAVEPSKRIGDEGMPDLIVSFAIEAPEGATVAADVNAIDFLRDVRMVKESWVDPGKNHELCSHSNLSHNVSNTVTVRADEWDDVAREIYEHRGVYSGVALLGSFGDLGYTQAPFVAVDGEGDRAAVATEWDQIRSLTVAVDFTRMIETENAINFGAAAACAGGACEIL